MIHLKLKFNELFLLLAVAIIAGVIGYFLPHQSLIKESPVLYKVVRVIDGDTIQVKAVNGRYDKTERIRLIGINTPEIFSSKECFGEEAYQEAKKLLRGRTVYLIPDPLSSNRGRYDRLLRYVFLPNGELVNAELVKNGFAFNYIYEPFQFMKQFDYLEKQAKEKRLGLWSNKCNYYFKTKER